MTKDLGKINQTRDTLAELGPIIDSLSKAKFLLQQYLILLEKQ